MRKFLFSTVQPGKCLPIFFTKPLQGSVFLKPWTAIMGHGPPSPQKEDHMSVLHNNDTNLEALDSNLEPNL